MLLLTLIYFVPMAIWTYQGFQVIRPYLQASDTLIAAYSIGAFLKYGDKIVNNPTLQPVNQKVTNTTAVGKNMAALGTITEIVANF